MPEKESVCRIEISFPVKSDDEAIAIKKLISESLKTIENIRFSFTIMER